MSVSDILSSFSETRRQIDQKPIKKHVSSLRKKKRLLTNKELDDTVSVIESVDFSYSVISEEVSKEQRKSIREDLSREKIYPSELPKIKDNIELSYKGSIIQTGKNVGVSAANAVGQHATQVTLNVFHFAGASAGATNGIAAIKELLSATKEPKKTTSKIFFKNTEISFEEVYLKKRSSIVGITIDDLISDHQISTRETLFGSSFEPWWYDLYRGTIGKLPYDEETDVKHDYMMRLEMNVNKMIEFGFTLSDISLIIEDKNKKGGENSLICVYSPMDIGFIDIFPFPEKIEMKESIADVKKLLLFFLLDSLMPSFKNLYIKGIENINELYPISVSVWGVVRKTIKGRKKNTWEIFLNKFKMREIGIDSKRIIDLMKASDPSKKHIKSYGKYNEKLSKIIVSSDKDPSKIVEDIQNEEYNARMEKSVNQPHKNPIFKNVYRLAYLVYAETDGSNLRKLFLRDDIDTSRTVSDNVNEILIIFGIEAARNFIYGRMFNLLLNEGIYIDPRHTALFADYMTRLGTVTPISYTGVRDQGADPIALASYMKAQPSLTAGAFGQNYPITSIASSLLVGKKNENFGTGLNKDLIPSSIRAQVYKETGVTPVRTLTSKSSKANPKKVLDSLNSGRKLQSYISPQVSLRSLGRGRRKRRKSKFKKIETLHDETSNATIGKGIPTTIKAYDQGIKTVLPSIIAQKAVSRLDRKTRKNGLVKMDIDSMNDSGNPNDHSKSSHLILENPQGTDNIVINRHIDQAKG